MRASRLQEAAQCRARGDLPIDRAPNPISDRSSFPLLSSVQILFCFLLLSHQQRCEQADFKRRRNVALVETCRLIAPQTQFLIGLRFLAIFCSNSSFLPSVASAAMRASRLQEAAQCSARGDLPIDRAPNPISDRSSFPLLSSVQILFCFLLLSHQQRCEQADFKRRPQCRARETCRLIAPQTQFLIGLRFLCYLLFKFSSVFFFCRISSDANRGGAMSRSWRPADCSRPKPNS